MIGFLETVIKVVIMEIKIFNFGPIKEFEFDLSKDLTIIYGKNYIGKSYAMAVMYLLLKHFLEIDLMQTGETVSREVRNEKNRAVEKEVLNGKECNISKEINDTIKNIFNRILSGKLGNSFKNTFGSLSDLKNSRRKSKPLIQLETSNDLFRFEVGQSLQVKEFSLDKETIARLSTGKTGYDPDGAEHILEFNAGSMKDGFDFFNLLTIFIGDRLRDIIKSITGEIEDIYFLPASRTGLYTGLESFYPIFAELSRKRTGIKEKIELSALKEPVADYTLRLSGIHLRPTKHKELREIVRYFEGDILKGEVNFDSDRKRLTYSPENSDVVLDMSFVSSMISELAPLVAYLKYILGEKSGGLEYTVGAVRPFIFIEEPEAHLHPEAQVKMAEVFKMLVEAGVKLVITSHSNYIFNKLSNMLIAKTLDAKRYAPIILKDTDKGSVSRLMEADDLGVEDENFIDTAEALYEEREHILETRNENPDDR